MKIQLSPKRIVKDALVVWSEHGPEVDIVMDLKNLTFKPGSIQELYSFHVLDHLFPEEVSVALNNWKTRLEKGGRLFVVVDDFEYISRAFVGGDITIGLINDRYAHPTQFNRDSLFNGLVSAGFKNDSINIWFADVPGLFKKQHYELILEGNNNE